MGTMAIERIIVLSALFAQTLSAPSGCIESCNFYETSYQSRHTSGGYQDHAGLVQGSTNLNDYDYAKPGNWTEHNQYNTDSGHGKVHEERGQYVGGSKRVRYYKKNFTSSYGAGNVNGADATELRESSGQRRYDSIHVPSNQHFDSQNTYNQLGQIVTKESGYDRVHSQQTQLSSARIDNQSEKLEDFGEYGVYSQVNQHIPSVNTQTIDTQHHVETIPGNWSRADTYRTDGGRGHVFEEEGQYVTGPKKVRYFKKNYTSSYSTSGVPQSNVGSATLNELHTELQRNLHKELDNFRRDFHQASSIGHTAATTHIDSTTGLSQETVGFHSNDLQTAESDNYGQLGYQRLPSTGTAHHYTEQQHREMHTDTRQHAQPYAQPTTTADTYGTDSQRTYQSRETYVSRGHPTPQPSHSSSGLVRVPLYRINYPTSSHDVHSSGHHIVDETQRAGVLSTHQSSVAQDQLLTGNTQRVYNPNPSYGTYPGSHGETRHYEERWSSSSRTGENLPRERTADYAHGHTERAHYDRVAYNEALQRGRHHAQGYDSHAQRYDTHAHMSGSNYNTAYRTNSGQLVTGAVDLGHMGHGADCTEETQQYQQETRYHRKYKRDDHHADVQQHETIGNNDFTQQTESQHEFGQQTENQHLEDLTQQSEQFTQQTQGSDDLTQQSGKLEFGQQTVNNPHLEDLTQQNEQFTQQSEGQLEFGQQTIGNQHLEDLTQPSGQFTQQTEGQLEFGQQTVDNQHLEDLTQQTQESDNLMQQTSGKLEIGQQTIGNQHLEDLTQQTQGSDNLTQQTSGKLEFGQQTIDNQHLEDLTQQTQGSDDLTQQTSGKLEFGQQTIDNQHLEDLTQQSEQFTQQTEGQLEFGQQTVDNQHLEDLTQQTQGSDDLTQQTSGKLEFGQQTIDNQHLEDLTQQSEQFTQQTEGQLEFGQQAIDHQHFEDLMQKTQESDDLGQHPVGNFEFGQQTDDTQQLEQFSQRTVRSDDLAQQTVSQLEFGEHAVDNQHLEDLTHQNKQFEQQTDDFTQQTVGKLEFGQQTQSIDKSAKPKNQHLEEFNPQSEELTQHTGEFHDFTQQTMGQLEFGQQTQQPHGSNKPKVDEQHLEYFTQQNEDLTQQVGGFDIFAEQTGSLEYGRQREQQQKPSWPDYNTQKLEHFSQQNSWSTDDLSQHSHQYPSYNNHEQSPEWQLEQMSQKTDFTQQTDHDRQLATNVPRPASKPKPRQRYQKYDFTSSHTDGTDTNLDDFFNPVEVNPEADRDNYQERNIEHSSRVTPNYRTSSIPHMQNQGSSVFDNEKENMDRLHWVHKSNDATVGLQWHYTYHPSDLTNIEGSHNNYYPHHNVDSMSQQTEDTQQQSKSFDFDQQETQDKHTRENTQQNTYTSQSSQTQNSEQIPSRVIPLQYNQNLQHTSGLDEQSTQTTEQTEHKIEARILEAYGGGPYDKWRNDDIYRGVTPNPSATLQPIYGEDSWIIREKPREVMPREFPTENTPKITTPATTEVVETTPQIIEITTEAAPLSFWSRLGHKITNTYDKAKEKAKEIFG